MHASATHDPATLTRLFSQAVLRELGKTGHSPLACRLLSKSTIPGALGADATLGDAFNLAFKSLKRVGNRDDYVYRTAIIQKIALGRHNLRTATVENELRAGKSKADIVIFNGTATAYEIKSERDSFRRLPNQLADYRSVFASVNVVTSPMQAHAALEIAPDDVGVLVLSSRFQLQVAREAINSPERTDPVAILDTLRANEAIEVLDRLGIPFPEMPNTQRWAALRNVYAELDPTIVHDQAVQVLKSTRSRSKLASLLPQLPFSLRAAALSADLSTTERRTLSAAAWQPLTAALDWS